MEVLVVGKLPSHTSPGLPMLGNSPNIIGKGKPFWGGRFNHLEKIGTLRSMVIDYVVFLTILYS
jgi:hypothetical protein